jgi:predicted Ser/Thr protein kinase
METKRVCPSCGKALAPDVPMGLCPECLIRAGFPTGTEPGAEDAGKRFVPPPVTELAQLFPQLEVLEFIGKGGMGAVYKARQPALDRFVALKILPPSTASDPGFAERFNREARALARLSHPNIVGVHDFGKAGNLHYLLMEFVDGANLREVERAGRLDPKQALSIVPQICEALQFAHGEGIVHRDIKPENILLDKKGRVKITDFGIAKILGVTPDKAALTGVRDVVGTPHYMAPEQIEKPQTVDHRADIYSLGVVFYEMLTGELPLGRFAAPSAKVQVDVRLDEVVLRALEKEPALRYQQANALKTEVETIATNPGKSPVQASASQTPSLPKVPWQIWIVVILLGLEGVGNLMSIPRQPQAALWLIAKGIFITGLLLRWRPVWFVFSVISIFHVIAFLQHQPIVALLNLILLALVVSTYSFYFPKHGQIISNERLKKRLLKIWACLVGILWLPVIGLGVFFIMAFVDERRGWNPNPTEAVVVPMTWMLSLLMPLAAWLMWRAAVSSPQPSVAKRWISPYLLIVSILVLMIGVAFSFWLRTTHPVPGPRFQVGVKSIPDWRPWSKMVFGPEIERVVLGPIPNRGAGMTTFAVDLDTGELLTPPEPKFPDSEWLISSGADAYSWAGVDTHELLVANGTAAIPVKPTAWDEFRPGLVLEVLSASIAARNGLVIRMSADQVPATFAFKTREGGVGLLQITGTTDDPRGVKIRYKLIQSPPEVLAANLSQQASESAANMQRPPRWINSRLLLLLLVFIAGAATLVVLLLRRRVSAGNAFLIVLLGLIGGFMILAVIWVAGYNRLGTNSRAISSNRSQRLNVPSAVHSSTNGRSAFLVHDDVNVHYVLLHEGEFNSSSRTQSNVRSLAWHEDYTLLLTNGLGFVIQREAVSPDFLRINGREYNLREGRMFKLFKAGRLEQLLVYPAPLAGGSMEQLGRLLAEQGSANNLAVPQVDK